MNRINSYASLKSRLNVAKVRSVSEIQNMRHEMDSDLWQYPVVEHLVHINRQKTIRRSGSACRLCQLTAMLGSFSWIYGVRREGTGEVGGSVG